jgi:SHS2 domain-containing protein
VGGLSAPSYEFVDAVTSDLRFVARAPTLDALFVAAADALLAATVEAPSQVRELVQREVRLEDPDLELLLLRFLGDLVWRRDVEGLLLRATRVALERGPDGAHRLRANLAGEPLARDRHALRAEVKAVTAHGLRITQDATGCTATVTLDV